MSDVHVSRGPPPAPFVFAEREPRLDMHMEKCDNERLDRFSDSRGFIDEAGTKVDVASVIQLAASGNSKTVEEQWMAALEQHVADSAQVASWSVLLKELADWGRLDEAETLAWAAIEAVRENGGPREALEVARPFLLALAQSDDLRIQVAELYIAAYADRENFAALLRRRASLAAGRRAAP